MLINIYKISLTEYLFKEALSFSATARLTLFAKGLLEAPQYLFLLARKISRCFDIYGDYYAALASWVVYVNDTLALESEGSARLGSLGDGDLLLAAAEHRDLYLCSERRLGKGDRYLTIEIVALSCEEVVIFNSDLDDEISVGAAVSSRRALSPEDDILISVNARGYIYLKLFVYLNESLAVTVLAGGFYYLTASATAGAGLLRLRVAENGLLLYGYVAAALTA